MTEASTKKGKSPAKAKKPRTAPSHPKVSEMVNSAIKDLKERSGSSLQAIKKYIAQNYKVDAEKLAPFIRKYLKTAVVDGGLIQTKGKGASGSFRMSNSATGGAAKASTKAKKSTAKPKSAKSASTPKKAAKPKKTPQKSKKPKKASPVKKTKPVAKTAPKKAKPTKTAAKKKPAKASPKKKAAASKKGKK